MCYNYDFSTGSWEESAPMLSPRGNHVSGRAGGKVVVVGGRGGGSTYETGEALDEATGVWEEISDYPDRRETACAVAIDESRIIVTGGLGNGNVFCNIYDVDTGEWTEAPEMSFPRYDHGCMKFNLEGQLVMCVLSLFKNQSVIQ